MSQSADSQSANDVDNPLATIVENDHLHHSTPEASNHMFSLCDVPSMRPFSLRRQEHHVTEVHSTMEAEVESGLQTAHSMSTLDDDYVCGGRSKEHWSLATSGLLRVPNGHLSRSSHTLNDENVSLLRTAMGESSNVRFFETNNSEGHRQHHSRHRGELTILEKYRYDLSRAQLKASSRTSALLAGFAMVALVELQYEATTPPYLLITLGVVTTLLVSVHLLALMMSTCILPYIEANGCTQDSPHNRLKFYIDLSWLFSTCIGLVLFLIEIGVIFFVKFIAVNYIVAAYITTAMLVPVLVVFTVFSCLIHKNRFIHSMNRVDTKVNDLQKFLSENDAAMAHLPNATSVQRHLGSEYDV